MLSRRNKIGLSLLCLLFLFYYFYETNFGSKPLNFTGQNEEINGLEILSPGLTLKLEKKQGLWLIVYPLEAQADQSQIETLVFQLLHIKTRRLIQNDAGASDQIAAQYGLCPPKHSLIIKQGKKIRKIYFGEINPSLDCFYAKLDRLNKIFLVSAYLEPYFSQKLEQFRQNSAVYCRPAETVQVSFGNENKKITLQKIGDTWQMLSPHQIKADPEAIDDFLVKLSLLKIRQFLPNGLPEGELLGKLVLNMKILPADCSKNPPPEKLIKPLRTELGIYRMPGNTKFYLGCRPPFGERFLLDKKTFDRLKPNAEEFIDRHLLSLNPEELGKIEIELPETDFLAQRQKTGWEISRPFKSTEYAYQVNQLLLLLSQIRYREKISASADLKRYGLEEPSGHIDLSDLEGKPIVRLNLGKKDRGHYYLQKNHETGLYLVNNAEIDRLIDFLKKNSLNPGRKTVNEKNL